MASSSPTPQRTMWADLIEWSVEVDFLVAQEKSGKTYTIDEGKRNRWVCPFNAEDPTDTCVTFCAEHIAYTLGIKPLALGGVAYKTSDKYSYTVEKAGRERTGMDPRMCYWFVSAAPNAVPRPDSPSEYNWIGIRVRCPYRHLISILHMDRYGKNDLGTGLAPPEGKMPPLPPVRGKTEMESVLGLIRAGIKTHTNSTCQLRVYMGLQNDGFDVTDAKKAVTLAWLMEPELLLPLRPFVRDPALSHYRPITRLSEIAMAESEFPAKGYTSLTVEERERLLAKTRPPFPTDADLMDTYIPTMSNSLVQERIQMIWSASTLEELSDMLRSSEGDSTVAVYEDSKVQPTMIFRYALWHPQREGMQYWLHLFGRLFLFAIASDAGRFKAAVARIEEKTLEVQKLKREDRCIEMLTHSFDFVLSYYWNEFKEAERGDGLLSPTGLDRQGTLALAAGIDYDSETERDSSSSSASSVEGGVWIKSS
ncbi:hypothetical protein FZEAL_1754 [Fusarium zealandicum]|uniref:Uncharacterized protein n=1 Tax=Fusarium zealandicum TaxID=1053134 RepID=A0A8H4US52_9HYPO|nr:hypothetical protein FZEAL_1754 [Fusarium zealandicum]